MHNAIGWFEIPAKKLARAKKFYEAIFEVKMQEMNLGDGLKMALFPVEPGTVGGAVCEHKDFYHPGEQGPLVYLNANPDIDKVLERIEKNGGKIFKQKTHISEEYGYMAVFFDPEGNRIALHSK
jgi:hypothetical protein